MGEALTEDGLGLVSLFLGFIVVYLGFGFLFARLDYTQGPRGNQTLIVALWPLYLGGLVVYGMGTAACEGYLYGHGAVHKWIAKRAMRV